MCLQLKEFQSSGQEIRIIIARIKIVKKKEYFQVLKAGLVRDMNYKLIK